MTGLRDATGEPVFDEGVLTVADRGSFAGAALLCHALRETYPAPVTCFDAGLDPGQRSWLEENRLCVVAPLPAPARGLHRAGGPVPVARLRPFLIAESPYGRACWLDPDLVAPGGLGELFQRLDGGPVFVPADRAPLAQARAASLAEPPFPAVEAGVSAWAPERDRRILDSYRRAALEAVPRADGALPPHADGGALARAVLESRAERRILDTLRWTPRGLDAGAEGGLLDSLRPERAPGRLVRLGEAARGGELEPALRRAIEERAPGHARAGRRGAARPVIRLLTMIPAKADLRLVQAFLDHYHRLGVDELLVALHREPGDVRGEAVRALLASYGAEPALETPVFSTVRKGRFYAAAAERCGPDDWVLYADLDELQVYPEPLPELLERCDREGYAFVRGEMLDRLAPDGRLVPIRPDLSLWEQFPLVARVTGRITGGWTGKICAARPSLRLGDGGPHRLAYGGGTRRDYALTRVDPRGYPGVIEVHHFKWDATLLRRTEEKLAAATGDLDSIDEPGFLREYEALRDHLGALGRIASDGAVPAGTPPLHYVREGRAAAEPPEAGAGPGEPSALERAAELVRLGPAGGWGSPAGRRPLGRIARGALLRALKPELVRRAELDGAVVEALLGLAGRHERAERRLAAILTRRSAEARPALAAVGGTERLQRAYVICATPRSGSNLLCELLAGTGVAGVPLEHFYTGAEEAYCRAWGVAPGRTYLEELVRRSTSPNGVFGLKVMWEFFPGLVERLRRDAPELDDRAALGRLLPDARFVWIGREDRLAQAVSRAIAERTGAWLSTQLPLGEAAFDADLIRRCLDDAARDEDAWRDWFERNRVAPLRLTYEQLVADMDGWVERILSFLEIPAPPTLGLAEGLELRPQRTELNREWAERYRRLEGRRPAEPVRHRPAG